MYFGLCKFSIYAHFSELVQYTMLYLISGLMFNLFENYMNGKNIIKLIFKFGMQPEESDFVHVVRVLTNSLGQDYKQ